MINESPKELDQAGRKALEDARLVSFPAEFIVKHKDTMAAMQKTCQEMGENCDIEGLDLLIKFFTVILHAAAVDGVARKTAECQAEEIKHWN